MAIRPLNSIAGFSTGDPAVTIVQANGDITTINFTANGVSNVGSIANFHITGGNSGDFLQTDGTGNLSFAPITVNTSNISNGTSNVSIDSANGNVTVSVNGSSNVAVFSSTGANVVALDVTGISNLGNVGNVKITGGNADQYLKTDGLGNLVWSDVANATSNIAAPMPYLIPTGESYIVKENFQGLYSQAITIDGELEVDGMLIEIVDTISSQDTQILFDYNGIPTGNTGFTFDYVTGNVSIPGNLAITGNIIPTANVTYNLGSSTKRFNDIWLSNSTIYIGDSSITTDANSLVLTSGSGATFEVSGNANVSTLQNGNSNISIDTNANITFSVAGTSNVLVLTSNGIAFTGNIDFSGNLDITGNIAPGGIKTDNYYYANGSPLDFQQAAGSNTQLQYNDGNGFGASSNLTFNDVTNVLTVAGNISAGNLLGANLLSANFVTGTLTTAAQPNITSIGILTTLETSGNAIVGGNLVVNGNITYINVDNIQVEDPIISLGGGPNGAPLITNDNKDRGTLLQYYTSQPVSAFMGWDNSNAEFAFGSNVSVAAEIVTFDTLGNIRAQTFKGNIEATTISGSLTTASQANITTVGTLGSLTVSGNITAGNINGGNLTYANYLVSNSGCVNINGAFVAYNNSTGAAGIFSSAATDINLGLAANIVAGSSTGLVTIQGNLVSNNNIYANSGTVKGSLLTGTLTTASQPNITTIGTLTNLTVSNNISSNTVTLTSTYGNRSNIAVVSDTVIDSFSKTAFRSAKYVIKSENDDGYESLEVLLIHNNINSFITVYAAINDGGGNTVAITTGINSGNVELRATGLAPNTVVNLIGTYVPD
jgi:hypothetical protein